MREKNLQWRRTLFLWLAVQSVPQMAGQGVWSVHFQMGHTGIIKSSCTMRNWFFLYHNLSSFWSTGILKTGREGNHVLILLIGESLRKKSKLSNQYQWAFLAPSVQVLGVVNGKSEKNGPWLRYAYPKFYRYFRLLQIAEFPSCIFLQVVMRWGEGRGEDSML